jgi:hypothetical protein
VIRCNERLRDKPQGINDKTIKRDMYKGGQSNACPPTGGDASVGTLCFAHPTILTQQAADELNRKEIKP